MAPAVQIQAGILGIPGVAGTGRSTPICKIHGIC